MLLAFDIGNTKISVGCFSGKELCFDIQLQTVIERTLDEYTALLLPLLQHKLPQGEKVTHCIISSVVPPLTGDLCELVQKLFNVDPLVVGPGVKTGIAIGTTDPSGVGADRVVNAVAVKSLYGAPALVVDFSTATSVDYINADAVYSGSSIIPGLRVSVNALVDRTAQLPRIELGMPQRVIGRNTREAMQSGAVIGYLCMIEGIVLRAIKEVGGVDTIVVTGPHGSMFSENSEILHLFDQHLTLKGLQIISELNQ